MFSLGRVVLYIVFMDFSLPKTLVKTLAKNLVKNLAKNLVKNLAKIWAKNLGGPFNNRRCGLSYEALHAPGGPKKG